MRLAASNAPYRGNERHTVVVAPKGPRLTKLLVDVYDEDIAAAAWALEKDGARPMPLDDHDPLRVFRRESPRFGLIGGGADFGICHATDDAAAEASRAANAYAMARSSSVPFEEYEAYRSI